MTEVPGAWCPLALPHAEVAGSRILCRGEPVEELGHPPGSAARLLARCDGSRPLDGFTAAERSLLGTWQRDGLVVMAPDGHPDRAAPDAPVVVSPHPDDAALALGGLLARRGGRVLDVFSVETWTKDPYYAGRPALTSRLLLAEEAVAARVLGTDVELLGFVDAADRAPRAERFFAGTALSEAFPDEEPGLFAELTTRLAGLLDGAAEICAPLGVGGHVDHLACREAVIALLARGDLTGARVVFYEDQPYSVFGSAEEVAQGLAARLTSLGLGALRPELCPMDATAALAKREALRAYRIQVRQGVVRRIARHGERLAERSGHPAAERIWPLVS
ncbi:PIG-L family deacetylase [Streptomyces sp. bgisy100]|uniref:PIG-L family deacetylase n=1 Tax=Streptomyces sp. bgisy100 TaxID=3413783 RepID=UPI003D742276